MQYLIIWLHFIADFILQTDYMAVNKSKSNRVLLGHALCYASPFILIVGIKYGLLNGLLHFGTDYISSRVTSNLWSKGDRRNFFIVIGLDQAVHLTCLLATL